MSHLNPHIQHSLKDKSLSLKSIEYYLDGIQAGDRYILAESITLLESQIVDHQRMAYLLLSRLSWNTKKTRRIGVTGSPGVGKSTFIESIGTDLIDNKRKVAVLTIDPSSSLTHGSILGDKTRMLELARHPSFFIRPSPSSKHLGGTHQHTYEALRLCEAAGYDDVIIETVGVGQSEIEVRDFTDLMILLVLPGSGDSLQGIKKGIMESTDIIIVHKADGARSQLASEMIKELKDAQHTLSKAAVPIYKYSSIESHQESILSKIEASFKKNEILVKNRSRYERKWIEKQLNQDIARKIELSISNQLNTEESQNKIDVESIFKEYLRLSKSLSVSISLK